MAATRATPQSSRHARTLFRAHWSIFLPALIVALLYGGSWLLLVALGHGDWALARLALLVAIFGVPLLLVHAYLKYSVLGLLIARRELLVRRGWIRPKWRRYRFGEVSAAAVQRGLVGRLTEAGTLVVTLRDGRRIRLDDLRSPDEAARQIQQRLR